MQKLARRLTWLKIDKIYYKEEEFYGHSILHNQILQKLKLMDENPCLRCQIQNNNFEGFNSSFRKKEDLRDFLLGLSVYTNGVIELHVP